MIRRSPGHVNGVLARTHLLPLVETVVAVALGCLVEVGVRVLPLPAVARRLGIRLAHDEADAALVEQLPRWAAVRLRAVARVMRRWPVGPEGKCLRIALVSGQRLRRLEPTLCLGVRHTDDGVLAHAWLSVDGRALDASAVHYAQLLRA